MAVADGSSAESSILEKEAENQISPITSAGEKDQEQSTADIISDTKEDQSPSLWKLGLMTIALSLSLFCIALV
jgi:hypothetical protein